MTWQEVQQKYRIAAKAALGEDASQEEIALFVYRTIVRKSCSTNEFFDRMAYRAPIRSMKPESLLNIIQSCRSVIAWTKSGGGSSSSGSSSRASMVVSDKEREHERKNSVMASMQSSSASSSNGRNVLHMECCSIHSTMDVDDHTRQLRCLLQPSISVAPSIYDHIEDSKIEMVGFINNNDDHTSRSYGSSTTNHIDDDSAEVYSIINTPQLTGSFACLSFLCLLISNCQQHFHGLDQLLASNF